MKHHPDRGGCHEVMTAVNSEYDSLFPQLKNVHKTKDGETYTAKQDSTVIILATPGQRSRNIRTRILQHADRHSRNTVRGKMILQPHGKEFFHFTVSRFLHSAVRSFLHSTVSTFLSGR
jgi:hypothetical protein